MNSFITRCIAVSAFLLTTLTVLLQSGCVALHGQMDRERAHPLAFDDVTDSCGLNVIDGALSAWGDYDSDGDEDVMIDTRLFSNDGDGTFSEEKDAPPGYGIWGDLNNDGHLDFLSLHEEQGGVYLNTGKGAFKLGAFPGNAPSSYPKAAFADVDNDGLLDIYITNYEMKFGGSMVADRFYLAKAGGGYKDPVNLCGKWAWAARGVNWSDFDEDGDMDAYVSNYRLMPNILWVNDGKGNFTDEAKARGVYGDAMAGKEPGTVWFPDYEYTGHTIGSCWGDLNNDGHMDLLVVNFSHKPKFQNRPQVLISSGPPDYRFTNINKDAAAGIYWQESYAKGSLADYDNDGDLDAYITTVYSGDRGELFNNDGTGIFTPVGDSLNLRTGFSYQVGWADHDNDGDLDLLVHGRLFRNSGNGNSWLKVRVVGGNGSNRSAVGARIRVRAGRRVQIREVSAGNSGNQNPLVQHFGLGGHEGRVKVEVQFPSGKRVTRRTPVRTVLLVEEPE